jgi:aryl-alcohol dehydrogenase-like predicted oxidoreductase
MILGEDSASSAVGTTTMRMIHQLLVADDNSVDTADVHATGRLEQFTGKALKGRPVQPVLATKSCFLRARGRMRMGSLDVLSVVAARTACAGRTPN